MWDDEDERIHTFSPSHYSIFFTTAQITLRHTTHSSPQPTPELRPHLWDGLDRSAPASAGRSSCGSALSSSSSSTCAFCLKPSSCLRVTCHSDVSLHSYACKWSHKAPDVFLFLQFRAKGHKLFHEYPTTNVFRSPSLWEYLLTCSICPNGKSVPTVYVAQEPAKRSGRKRGRDTMIRVTFCVFPEENFLVITAVSSHVLPYDFTMIRKQNELTMST